MTATILTSLPAWEQAVWEGEGNARRLVNRGTEQALWSGKGPPPAIGEVVEIAGPRDEKMTVSHYEIEDGWLMIWGRRHSDGFRGNLAGAEIRWPKLEAER